MRRRRRVGFDVHRSGVQLNVDHRVVTKLLDDGGEPRHQGGPAQELRPEAEDEVPDVPDRQVEAVDRALDASFDLVRVVPHELGDVLERKANGIDVLDDAVMEVLADALALVDDRQPLDLLVQPGVLDGDPSMDRERLDKALVGLGELSGAHLVGQIQVADRAAFHVDRHAKEAVHGRVIRREPMPPRIDGDVRDAEGAVFLDDQTEEAVAAREWADRGSGLAAHPGGDEGLDHAMSMDGPEGRIVRPHEQPDLVDDDLQDIVHGLQAGDGPGGGIEGVDDAGRCLCRPGGRACATR